MPRRDQAVTIALVAVILAAGVSSTWLIWVTGVRRLSEDALEDADIVAQSFNLEDLSNLTGTEADLSSPDYVQIKDQLARVRKAHRTCRFLYLMGREENGVVFFFVDSQPLDSEDYAPPGLKYEEVPDEYLHTFDTGEKQTVGPIRDRWGTLVTSLVPLFADESGEMLAVLGMDVDATDWSREVVSECMLPVSLTISIMLLTVLLLVINRNRRTAIRQYEEKNRLAEELQETLSQVKQLRGLIPVCASCKRVKDDQGYWNQIEAYITEHSEAQFSHGLCEECMRRLYPDSGQGE